MTLYETIFTRRSVRKYHQTPLDEQTLADIKSFLQNTKQLDGQNAWFEFVGPEAVTNKWAPHYIIAYCKNTTAEYINVGYVLQNVDLYLQSKCLGSVWLGMPNPKGELKTDEHCIIMAFGKTDASRRKGVGDFKRIPVLEISNQDNAVAQAARVAPSAVNSQPWKLSFTEGKVSIEYLGRGLMKLLLRKMNKIDVGIVTRHVVVALENERKKVKSITIGGTEKNPKVEVAYE